MVITESMDIDVLEYREQTQERTSTVRVALQDELVPGVYEKIKELKISFDRVFPDIHDPALMVGVISQIEALPEP
jgi:hypothetical protein